MLTQVVHVKALVVRRHETFTAMAPHLHLLLLAVPVAVVAGIVLSRLRATLHLGNDLWAWLGLLGGCSSSHGRMSADPATLPSSSAAHLRPPNDDVSATAAWLILAVWTVLALVSLGAPKTQANVPVG